MTKPSDKLKQKLKLALDNGSSSKYFSHLVPDEPIYQMTNSDHIAELRVELLEEQDYICPICNKKIDPSKAVLDHSHRAQAQGTGLIRSVLCAGCNMFLGKIENNLIRNSLNPEEVPIILPNIVKYMLETKHKPFVHPELNPKPRRLKKSSYNKLVQIYKEKGLSLSDVPFYPKREYITDKMLRCFQAINLEPEYYKD